MPGGFALCIGLNSVNPLHYQGWSGDLRACEADAKDMGFLAASLGFSVRTLLTADATRRNFIAAMGTVADKAKAGDIVLVSYSGHGGQVPDLNGDEPDEKDETWCLYDGQLIDDETFLLLSRFRKGVRVVVLSDSCHSGTAIKERLLADAELTTVRTDAGSRESNSFRYKAMPRDIEQKTYQANKAFYDAILLDPVIVRALNEVQANCILISGCQDNQLSADGDLNGRFTARLKQVWANGSFNGNYSKFHKAICLTMPTDQTPNLFALGPSTDAFLSERPFSILSGGNPMKIVAGDQVMDLHGRRLVIDFSDVRCTSSDDFSKMVDAIKPMMATALSKASIENREWSVSGSVTTTSGGTSATVGGSYTGGRDWSGSISASTPISGGVSGTVTVSTGSSGTSGSIGISGTF